MALMSNLRDKTHIILYILLASFLGLIVFEWGMDFAGFGGRGGRGQNAGSVNGVSMSYSQYDQLYRQFSENYRRSNPGADMSPEIELRIQEQAWNTVVDQMLLEQQFQKFGITVQDGEILAAINRPDPPQVIAGNFTDPATAQIDRQKLDAARRDPQNSEMWVQVEEIIRRELKIDKLIRALRTMEHVTDLELETLVRQQYTRMAASFIPVPFSFAGDDSKYPVKEDEIKRYYGEHRELFAEAPSRSSDYVFFPLTPSAQDSLAAQQEFASIRAGFATTRNDTDFVRMQSDRSSSINETLDRSDFSPVAGAALFGSSSLRAGSIIGPIADSGTYRLLKIKSVTTARKPVARASHILIRFNPNSRADIQKGRALSDMILRELKAGGNFAELARRYSADPGSAARGGDLGWFRSDRMVPEFADAVFASKPGAIVGPVQTQFGLHIIKVAGFDRKAVVASEIVRTIRPSSETAEGIRRRAMVFQMDAKEKGMDESASADKLPLETTGQFGRHMPIAAIGYNDKIDDFAFRSSEGDLSDVIETPKGFYVMRLTGKNDSGYRKLDDDLKAGITTEIIKEKKGEFIKNRLASLAASPGATLAAIAAADSSFSMFSASDIRWSDGFIPGYGVDRPLVEAMAGMPLARLSEPVQIQSGYAVCEVSSRALPEGLDIKTEKAGIAPQVLGLKQEQLFSAYFSALRKQAKIEDLRP
ncbi:peptidylprolyl isomerase [Chlorobium phaeovibrioides]|uniref:peptidylprolyl isomerase n=1 Tax=Chlorobium phaeovibrioides TaxID=1094 RepID=UPI00123170BA|nr:peptidylprolyl isomerase [Chlorobium phaeovibrioides]QEQ56450.1 peptidylprolyl isomerase [Chlorobium phaeovibrioides]